jgi:hypothetical protein
MSISNQGAGTPDSLRDYAQTITDTGDVVSRFQAMSNTEAETLRAQLRVTE